MSTRGIATELLSHRYNVEKLLDDLVGIITVS